MRRMRRYLLPLLVFGLAGVLILVLVKMGEEPPPPTPPTEPPTVQKPAAEKPPESWRDQKRDTRISLEENAALSELERTMQRKDLSRALYFRSKVCENLDAVLGSEKQTEVLLDLIRKYGLESDDPKQRDVVLPILRVLDHPEAAAMIEKAYYGSKDDAERSMLMEAMAHPSHDPKKAAVWAVEEALTQENKEWRDRAFEVIHQYSGDNELIFDVAEQIYEASTRPDQRLRALEAMSSSGWMFPKAKEKLRWLMEHPPNHEELLMTIAGISTWGDERDLARLDQLAVEFPDLKRNFEEQKVLLRDELKDRRRIESGKTGDEEPREEPLPPDFDPNAVRENDTQPPPPPPDEPQGDG